MTILKDEEGKHIFYDIDREIAQDYLVDLPGFNNYDVPHGEILLCFLHPKRDLYPLLKKQGVIIKETHDDDVYYPGRRSDNGNSINRKRHKRPIEW